MKNQTTEYKKTLKVLNEELKQPLSSQVRNKYLKRIKDIEWSIILIRALAKTGEETYQAKSIEDLEMGIKRLQENPQTEEYRVDKDNLKIDSYRINRKKLTVTVFYRKD